MRQADRVIAECPQDLQDMRLHYGLDGVNVSVIPCGFDPEELRPIDQQAARDALDLPRDEAIVLQLGRMVPRKGVDTVIQSIGRLRHDRGIDARLLVVGGDGEDPANQISPELKRLGQVARHEGVDDRVTFIGRRGRQVLKLYYSAADVFVTVPWYEPFGITPLEAMACGTPVIGSAVGGIKHTVAHGETGFLVPPRDPDAIAEKLALLLSEPDLRREMSLDAIRRVNERFTWSQVGEMLSSAYETTSRPAALTQVRPKQTEVEMQPMATSTEEATIQRGFDGAIAALNASRNTLAGDLATLADMLADCFARGGKLLVCGNGGSAADAQHLVAELVGRFKHPTRAPLAAIALTADTAVLTAWSNDATFADVFARQVEALGRSGDVLLVISTSGRSRNILAALELANERGLRTIAMLGGDGGEARTLASAPLVVPSSDTQHIQEVHLVLMHVLCELVETRMLACADPGEPEPRIVNLPRKPVGTAATARRPAVRLKESVAP
jgi:phosphoheptose isomerase